MRQQSILRTSQYYPQTNIYVLWQALTPTIWCLSPPSSHHIHTFQHASYVDSPEVFPYLHIPRWQILAPCRYSKPAVWQRSRAAPVISLPVCVWENLFEFNQHIANIVYNKYTACTHKDACAFIARDAVKRTNIRKMTQIHARKWNKLPIAAQNVHC